MTLAEFYDQLKSHDWYYAMSDDGRAYRAGAADYDRLRELAKDIEGAPEMMSTFSRHHGARVTGDEIPPLPERPAE